MVDVIVLMLLYIHILVKYLLFYFIITMKVDQDEDEILTNQYFNYGFVFHEDQSFFNDQKLFSFHNYFIRFI